MSLLCAKATTSRVVLNRAGAGRPCLPVAILFHALGAVSSTQCFGKHRTLPGACFAFSADSGSLIPSHAARCFKKDLGRFKGFRLASAVRGHKSMQMAHERGISDSVSTFRNDALSFLSPGQAEGKGQLVLIMGNEASDLDSIVCAIVLAAGIASGALDSKLSLDPGQYVVAPVMNIPSSEFPLRQDAVFLMKQHNIAPESLLFFPELPDTYLKEILAQNRLKLILVDHNSLGIDHQWLEPAVCAVIDHHEDSDTFSDALLRIVDPTVGSCASLVADLLFREGAGAVIEQRDVQGLVSGPLLLDTQLFKGKAAALDLEIASQLRLRTGDTVSEGARALYERLLKSRTDVSGLDSSQRLRKDYKRWGEPPGSYGIATVPCSLAEWVEADAELESAMAAHAEREGVVLLLAMMTYLGEEGGFCRDLLVYAPDRGLQEQCVAFLSQESFPSFQQVVHARLSV